MSTAARIRRQIFHFTSEKPFSIRDFLSHGPRAAEVAQAKAAAFKRTIATHGAVAALALKLTQGALAEHVFAVNGHSSSFRFGAVVIRFIGTCARKMHLGDEPVGLTLRALWYLGKGALNVPLVSRATQSFKRSDRQRLRQSLDLMPGWMPGLFPSLGRWQSRIIT
jgi:hypothetical protein